MGIFSKEDKNKDKDKGKEPEEGRGTEIDLPPEIGALKERVLKAGMPQNVEDVALKEIERLAATGSSTSEYTIGVNYLGYLASLPWNSHTDDDPDIVHAQAILDEDHHGLPEIKDRILEHLAVRMLKSSRKNRVLVVDDEKMARKNLEYVLAKDGYQVTVAATGVEAVEAMDRTAFDLVITDLKMEKVDGMDVLEAAKKKDPSVVVIIVTGYATVPVAVAAMQKGSGHFLSKPLKLEEIRATVKEALATKAVHLNARGPVLCFVGPPGTGKTSLGMSIARSLGRKFVRISLAGVKDEAEIRGHRRSYVGALPGRIIQEIRRVEVNNPLIMLDEIDKLGQEFKGDPAAALLELLDPEQNSQFTDHYLDIPFDLSRAMFIATANTTGPVPAPLLDRLEILRLSGYTEREKERIAFDHLIPREIVEAGLRPENCRFSPEAVAALIREHTSEAGLRGLQRQIASVCRKVAREILTGDTETIEIDPETVRRYLGPPKYRMETADAKDRIGVATGLALTESGGQIMFIEASMMKGARNLILTGSLGDVMKESAQAALSYLRSHTEAFGIDNGFFDDHDIHIHVPAGAIPKDGPSAGLTIAVALSSLLTQTPCKRQVAMTGELTLTGRILPVGGMKEKLLAAHRSGVRTAIFPEKNRHDMVDVPEDVTADLAIVFADEFEEVVGMALKGWKRHE